MGCSKSKLTQIDLIHESYLIKAKILMQQEKFPEALEIYETLLAEAPQNPVIFNKIGFCLSMMGENHKAINFYDRAILAQPRKAFYFNKGNSYIQMNQIEKALNCFYQALEISDMDWDLNNNIGFCLYKLGKQEEALVFIDKALELNLTNHLANYNKGNILCELGKRREALEFYEVAITLCRTNSDYYFQRGRCYYEMRDNNQAMEDFNSAIEIQKENIYYYYRGLCKNELMIDSTEDFERAKGISDSSKDKTTPEKELSILSEKSSESSQQEATDIKFLIQKSRALLESKDYVKAIIVNEQILKSNPNHYNSHYIIGLCNERIGKFNEAIKSYDIAINHDYNKDEFFFHKGKCLYLNKQYNESIDNLNNAIALNNTRSIEPYYLKSLAQIALFKEEESIRTIQIGRLKCKDSNEPHLLSFYEGMIMLKNDKFQQSIICFDETISKSFKYHPAMYQKTLVLIQLGDFNDALNSINMAISFDLNNSLYLVTKALVFYKLNNIESMNKIIRKISAFSNSKENPLSGLSTKDRNIINRTLDYITNGKKINETASSFISRGDAATNLTLLQEISVGNHGKIFNGLYQGKMVSIEVIGVGVDTNNTLCTLINNTIQADDQLSKNHSKIIKYITCIKNNREISLISESFNYNLRYYLLESGIEFNLDKSITLLQKLIETFCWCVKNKVDINVMSDMNLVIVNENEEMIIKVAYNQLEKILGDYNKRTYDLYTFIPLKKITNMQGYTQTIQEGYAYSFGMLMWEVLSKRLPYNTLGCKTKEQYINLIHAYGKPSLSHLERIISNRLLSLMRRCWNVDPKERPSLNEISLELSKNDIIYGVA